MTFGRRKRKRRSLEVGAVARLVVFEGISLDGVMQSPARPDEDERGGFKQGGWGIPYADAVAQAEMGKRMGRRGALLLGRRTYEDFYQVWPNRPETKDNPYTAVLNKTQKYVVSRTLKEPLPWMNSTLLKGEAEDTVPKLKRELDGDLAVLGSGNLVQSLLKQNLVDELVLSIHPLTLGSGRKLFPEPGVFAKFRLAGSVPTTTGVVIADYLLIGPST
jgi:dihydrofolate reductase